MITGKWQGEVNTPLGPQHWKFVLNEIEGKVEGRSTYVENENETVDIRNGRNDGEKVVFEMTHTSPFFGESDFKIKLTPDGDNYTGTLKMSYGRQPIILKRSE